MGKPSRTVILSLNFDPVERGYIREDILEMTNSWAVVYDRQMISIRRETTSQQQFKYIKLIYPDRGRAVALAKQLNKDYNTDKFRVIRLEQIMRNATEDEFVDLSMETVQTQRRRGRPHGARGVLKSKTLLTQRIVAVEEIQSETLDDLLD